MSRSSGSHFVFRSNNQESDSESEEFRLSLYPFIVHHVIMRGHAIRDTYTLQARRKEYNNIFLIIIRQHAAFPSAGTQEIRFNMQQRKALEFYKDKIDEMLQKVINDPTFYKSKYFIGGPIHADIFFGAERGPTVQLYMALYNHVN